MIFVLGLLASAALALVLTHLARPWALRVGLVAAPYTVRGAASPRVAVAGGTAIFLAVALVVGTVVVTGVYPDLALPAATFTALALGGTAIFLLGLWDDIHALSALSKLPVALLVAAGMYLAGIRIAGIELPGGAEMVLPAWLSFLITTLWIVGVTNAVNLIDGSDGVAAGVGFFASAALAGVSLLVGNAPVAFLAVCVAGAACGFLYFNFPPASTFLGDAGSLFIGFMLATLGILVTQPTPPAMPSTVMVLIPMVALGVPLLDTALAVVRRFMRGDSIFSGDRAHIHHRLLDSGYPPRMVALLLYAASIASAASAIGLVQRPGLATAAPLLLMACVAVWLLVWRLKVPELQEARNVLQRVLLQRRATAYNLRVREATARIRTATTADELLEALTAAFDAGEFERVEVWLPAEVAGPLANPLAKVAGTTAHEEAHTWRWQSNGHPPNGDALELRIPLFQAAGRPGRLSLWRPSNGHGLLTDLRLFTADLQPELERCLHRLANGGGQEGAPESGNGVAAGNGNGRVAASGAGEVGEEPAHVGRKT